MQGLPCWCDNEADTLVEYRRPHWPGPWDALELKVPFEHTLMVLLFDLAASPLWEYARPLHTRPNCLQ